MRTLLLIAFPCRMTKKTAMRYRASGKDVHLGAKLKYQIPYEWEHFQTIQSSAPIGERTIFATFSSVFQVSNGFRSVLDRFCSVFCVFSASSSSPPCFRRHRRSIDQQHFEKDFQKYFEKKLKKKLFLIL